MDTPPKKPGFQSSATADREHKLESERQDRIAQLEGHVRVEKENLRAQEYAYVLVRQQITKLQANKNRPIGSLSTTQAQVFERQTTTKISEDEKKLQKLETEVSDLDRAEKNNDELLVSKNQKNSQKVALAQKEQEEKKDTQLILKIKKEIELKTQELQKIEQEHDEVLRDIVELKKQPKQDDFVKKAEQNAKTAAGKRKEAEVLRAEIEKLEQSLDSKKQETEKAGKDLSDKKRQAEMEEKEALEKEKLILNRIEAFKQNIKTWEAQIQELKRH